MKVPSDAFTCKLPDVDTETAFLAKTNKASSFAWNIILPAVIVA
jgi:hypothetical protein